MKCAKLLSSPHHSLSTNPFTQPSFVSCRSLCQNDPDHTIEVVQDGLLEFFANIVHLFFFRLHVFIHYSFSHIIRCFTKCLALHLSRTLWSEIGKVYLQARLISGCLDTAFVWPVLGVVFQKSTFSLPRLVIFYAEMSP